MWTTVIILVLSAVFFASGKIRSDIVALCSLTALLLFHILTPEEALSGFSNSVVVMMVGLFVVGGAIFQTGLAKMISSRILKLAGKSELRLFILVMVVTAAIGAFVSNTGTVALMLPIVVSMAAAAGTNASRLLMPLAFASSMGGMMTLIGTPPNLVIQDALTGAGYPALSFFSFLPVGIICVAVGIAVLLPLSKMFLSKKEGEKTQAHSGKTLKDLTREYGLANDLFRLRVPAGSPLAGKTIQELDIRQKHGLNILEVRRESGRQHRFLKTVTQKLAEPGMALREEDILYVKGPAGQVDLWIRESGLNLLCAPGNDLVASTALAAAGCQIVLFTTGRGTPFGTFVPTAKISTNSRIASLKPGWIDFNAGVILDGKPVASVDDEFIDFVLSVASGEKTCNEKSSYSEIAIFKTGVTL